MKVGVTLPVGNHRGDPPAAFTDVLDVARRAEDAGLDSIWVFDHLLFRMPDQAESGALEGWTVLSALAMATQRVELGTLVLGLRLRNPGLLAKMAVTLDEISNGRLTLGVGAGWHDPELEAFGYPTDHRIGRFEESMEILAGLLREGRATFEGNWVTARNANLLPPATRRIPLHLAAKGPRMLRAVARYGDAWNAAWFSDPDDPALLERIRLVDEACRERGREPSSLARTVGIREPLGAGEDLARSLAGFAARGFEQAIAWLDPMTGASVDRLAAAVREARGD